MNTILINKSNDPFSRVPKSLLNDEGLSWRAKGILSYLLGKHNGWKTNTDDIKSKGSEGRDAVRRALNDAISNGYAKWEFNRDADGRVNGRTLIVSDSKFTESLEIRRTDFPTDGFPVTNKNKKKNKNNKKQEGGLSGEVSDHRRFIEKYCVLYEQQFKKKYFFDRRFDPKAVEALIDSGVTPEEALDVAHRSFNRGRYPFDAAYSIKGLVNNWSKIVAALEQPEFKFESPHLLDKKISALKLAIMAHPANPESRKHVSGVTDTADAKAELDELKSKLAQLSKRFIS